MMNHATSIEKLTELQNTFEQLLKQLQVRNADNFRGSRLGSEAISSSLRAAEQGQQGYRTRVNVKFTG